MAIGTTVQFIDRRDPVRKGLVGRKGRILAVLGASLALVAFEGESFAQTVDVNLSQLTRV